MLIEDIAYISREIENANLFSVPEFANLSEALVNDVEEATRITIVSGYFGVEYILKLLKKPTKQRRAQCTVRIILGYDNTTEFIYEKVKEEALCNEIISIGYKRKRVIVRLFKDSVPLHTKLYGFLRTTSHSWYVGSANASSAIEGKRHELMLRISGRSEALEKYVDALLKYQPSQEQGEQLRNFQEYLSSGSLVFKPTRSRRFTYDAFSITPDERKKISERLGKNSSVPHSDPNAEGFGFNLLSAIGINGEANDERTPTLRFRRYCIETAYGYWAPEIYVQAIEKALDMSRKSDKKTLEDIKDRLNLMKDNDILEEFEKYKSSTEKFFKDLNINPTQRDIESFGRFINVRRVWLNDEGWIKRSASKITISPMPNIWSNEDATESFIASFVDDLVAALNAPGNTPLIYSELQKNFDIPASPDTETVREVLTKRFSIEP